MLNYAMTYPGKFPPKFELSNSSHARKAEESFAMHTIVHSEWCPAASRARFPCTFRNFWPTAEISTPTPLPHHLFSPTTIHISHVLSLLPSEAISVSSLDSSLSPSRILPPGSPWSSSMTSLAVPPPTTNPSLPGYASLLSILGYDLEWRILTW